MRAVCRYIASATVLVLASALVGCSPTPDGSVTLGPSGSTSPPGEPATSGDPAARAAELAAGLADVDLIGQVLMPSVNLDDPAAGSAELVAEYRLGSVILMGEVRATDAGGAAAAVRALTGKLQATSAELPAKADLLIATDQEYGWVTRIESGIVQLPSAMAFGAAGRANLTEEAWLGAGRELAAIGINVNLAPDADVIGSPGNRIIGSRSYGSDPAVVAEQVAAAVRGLRAAGVAATVKHFPGHGHTTADSHQALPVLRQSRSALASSDLPPFQAGVDAGVEFVMSGHLDVRAIDPGVPASFSRKVLVDLLRKQMGFTGVVMTDALNMAPAMRWPPGEAAVRALLAGNDLLLMPPDVAAARQGLLAALDTGRLPRERLIEAVTRVLTVKLRLAAERPTRSSTLESAVHRDAALAVAAAAVTVLRGPCSGPLVPGPVRVTAAAGRDQQRARLALADALRASGVTVVATGGEAVHLVGHGDGTADLSAGAAVTVAMDTPYLLGSAGSAVRVATYSATAEAMRALAAVIAGKAKAPGRSPVDVTGLPRSACAEPTPRP